MGPSRRLTALAGSISGRADFPPGPLVIALSGGADSAACAWLAVRRGLPARAVHVHHLLPASEPLAGAARSVAATLDLPLTVVWLERTPAGEAEARDGRYRALEGELSGGETLVTAHTRDDLAETVLAALLRGAGTDGLAGIPPRRGRVARPLLGVWRSETRELATLAGLPWLDDPANEGDHALRNRIRSELIPRLEAEYRPHLREVLAGGAEVLRDEVALLDGLAGRVPVMAEGGSVRVPLGPLRAAGPVVGARVIRAAAVLAHPPHPPGREATRRAWDVATGVVAGAQLPGGVTVRRSGPWLELDPGAGDLPGG